MQCVHQPREGRGRNRQTPLPKEKHRGKGAREKPTATDPPAHKRRPNPPARRHRRLHPLKEHLGFTRIGEEERRDGEAIALHKTHTHPAKTGDTQPRAAAGQKKGHPEHADTHLARAGTEKKTHEGAARARGEGGTVSTRPKTGTASYGHDNARTRHATTSRPVKKKRNQRGGGGTNPYNSNTWTPPRHRLPPSR